MQLGGSWPCHRAPAPACEGCSLGRAASSAALWGAARGEQQSQVSWGGCKQPAAPRRIPGPSLSAEKPPHGAWGAPILLLPQNKAPHTRAYPTRGTPSLHPAGSKPLESPGQAWDDPPQHFWGALGPPTSHSVPSSRSTATSMPAGIIRQEKSPMRMPKASAQAGKR